MGWIPSRLPSIMCRWPESRSRRDKHALWGSTWPGVKIKQQLVEWKSVPASTYLGDGFIRVWWKPYSTFVARRHSITLILKCEVAALFISTQLFAITKTAPPGSFTSVAFRGLNSISFAYGEEEQRAISRVAWLCLGSINQTSLPLDIFFSSFISGDLKNE